MSEPPEQPHAPEPEVALSEDEELLARFARTRDPDLREEIAIRYRELAISLSHRYRGRGESDEDLEQVAQLGLLKAIDGFDETRGGSLEAYATPTILGELRRHFRDRRWAMRVPRAIQEALPRIREAVDGLSTELGREPETEEVAEEVEMEPEEVLDALAAAERARPASLEAPLAAEPDAGTVGEIVGTEDENIEHTEWGVILERRLEGLEPRDRDVIYLRFVEDMTQEEIGEEIGVSQMQVSRILRSALGQLRDG